MPSLHIDLQQLAAQENKKRQSSKIKAEEAYAQMSEDFEAKEEEAVLRY